MGDHGFDAFWALVPNGKKTGKRAAEKAYIQAVRRLCAERQCQAHVAAGWLRERLKAFYASPKGQGDITGRIHMSTWLNQGRYDDSDESWSEGVIAGETVTQEETDGNADRQRRIEEIRRRRGKSS